ncbi:hypothetical protein FACS189451_12840 [Bacteroidia bacterium]|nr:hypothetical protein FACS189446_8690 [Bacteroidia bacterium]GHT65138.1 hypothetical protein FACS189451_12840 [Bacteroidia bacterium]
MREKMKKMLFLMLFLIILGAANVTSQVRIGGNGAPNGAAVLDLNATNGTNSGTKTLALPRVSLSSTTDKLSNATLINGMLVYNTNNSVGEGVYYWDGSQWVKPGGTYSGSTSITLSGTEFRREALTGDVTADENSNLTSIADGAVNSAKILDGSIDSVDLGPGSVGSSHIRDGSVGLSKTTSLIFHVYSGSVPANSTKDTVLASMVASLKNHHFCVPVRGGNVDWKVTLLSSNTWVYRIRNDGSSGAAGFAYAICFLD